MVDTSGHRRRLAARFETHPCGRDGYATRNRSACRRDRAPACTARQAPARPPSPSALAGTIFIIRVFSAALAYLRADPAGALDGDVRNTASTSMCWTWVLLLGSMMDFGISASAQKIIPEYRARGGHALLRGFLSGSRWLTFARRLRSSLLLAGSRDPGCRPGSTLDAVVPLYIGCLTLPAFVVANTQDGIARSHDWMQLGLMPQFIVRQTLIIGLTAGAFVLGFNLGATAAMIASAAAVWLAVGGQMIVLNRRLARPYRRRSPKAYDVRGWLTISLPILMVEGFYLLLSHTDVLVLQQFRSSEEVGVYFAVVKTLALVSFVHYAMSATTAHRFAEYNAHGDKARLVGLCRARHQVDVLAVAGRNRSCCWRSASRCCGCSARNSSSATSIMFVAAIGLVVRSRDRPGRAAASTCSATSISARIAYALAFVHEPGAVHRCWCRASAAMARRPRPRSR